MYRLRNRFLLFYREIHRWANLVWRICTILYSTIFELPYWNSVMMQNEFVRLQLPPNEIIIRNEMTGGKEKRQAMWNIRKLFGRMHKSHTIVYIPFKLNCILLCRSSRDLDARNKVGKFWRWWNVCFTCEHNTYIYAYRCAWCLSSYFFLCEENAVIFSFARMVLVSLRRQRLEAQQSKK